MIQNSEQKKKSSYNFFEYQHCLLLDEPANIIVDDQKIKKALKNSKAWFARYITEYDVAIPTEWWYCIKDSTYNVDNLKAKMRYEIKKGRKNFYVKEINPFDYDNEIYEIDKKKFAEYPKKYRPIVKKNGSKYLKDDAVQVDKIWFGLFDNIENRLKGYAIILEKDNYFINLSVVAIYPETYRLNSSAALVDGILHYYENKEGTYTICDGSRNIKHITNYQKFLVSTFDFRYVYCKMKVIYKWWVKPIIFLTRPFKKILLKSNNSALYNVGCVLQMDKYARLTQR